MQPSPPSADDLEDLNDFLSSERSPESCMSLSELDGFLTGIAVGPEPILPAHWLSAVWGGVPPQFESPEEEARIQGIVTGRYSAIVHALANDPAAFDPVFWEMEDGTVVVSDWCEGFADAMRLRPEAWQPMLEVEDTRDLINPILVFVMDEDGDSFIDRMQDDDEDFEREMAELIKPSVVAIDGYWKLRRGRA